MKFWNALVKLLQPVKHNKTNRELKQSYLWISPKPTTKDLHPYVFTFRIVPIPNGDAIPYAVKQGLELRRFVHEHVLWKVALNDVSDTVGQNLKVDWDEIIPSASRFPTHRLEIGIIRKKGSQHRSRFLNEYFCFLPKSGVSSDVIANEICGYLKARLEEQKNFQGEALLVNRSYWLMAIIVAWKAYR